MQTLRKREASYQRGTIFLIITTLVMFTAMCCVNGDNQELRRTVEELEGKFLDKALQSNEELSHCIDLLNGASDEGYADWIATEEGI